MPPPALLDDPAAPDLLSLGTRCGTCATADFLPWTCPGCDRAFCADHRGPAAHACPTPPQPGGRVVVPCPVCACGVELPAGVGLRDEAGVSAVVDAHMRSAACDPSNYSRVHAKPRCPVPGCRTALTLVNGYECRACGVRVCLGHRHGADHACAGLPSKAAGAAPVKRPGIAATFRTFREALRRSGSGRVASPPRGGGAPAAAAAAAAARRLTGGGGHGSTTTAVASPRPAAAVAAQRRAAIAASPSCPVCGLAGASLRAVRAHHAAAHPGAAPLPAAGCVLS